MCISLILFFLSSLSLKVWMRLSFILGPFDLITLKDMKFKILVLIAVPIELL